MILVSVLVPVYNVEKYLRECLDSILRQTYKNFELILCDDGSTDTSGAICDEYAGKDSRIRVIHKKNEGITKTRKILLDNAVGDYVLWVDSDDWINTNLIEKTITCAEETNSDVVMVGHCTVMDSGEEIKCNADLYGHKCIYSGNQLQKIYCDFGTTRKLNSLWDKLIARNLFFKEDRESVCNEYVTGEDWLLLMPVISRMKSFVYLAEPLYFYRRSVSGKGQNFKLAYFSDSNYVGGKRLEFLKNVGADTEENRQKFYVNRLLGIVKNTESAVHAEQFSSDVLKKTFQELFASELYQNARKYEKSFSESMLDKIVYWLFDHQYFGGLIYFLKLEKYLLKVWREKK